MHQHQHRGRSLASWAVATGAAVLLTGAVAAPAAAATDDPRVDTVYTSEPADAAPSYPSVGFTATSTMEIGEHIALAGEARALEGVTVSLNSWACETGTWNGGDCVTTEGSSYDHDITLHVYEVAAGGTVGAELAAVTQTVAVPYRPSADPASCSGSTSQWYSAAADSCQNGYSFPVDFDLDGVVVPDEVIVSVTYPTSRFGEIADPGPYDSLNVDVVSDAPSIGTDVDRDAIMIDSSYYGTSAFGPLSGWDPYTLRMTVTATPAADLVEVAPSVLDFEAGDASGLGLVTAVEGGTLAATGCWHGVAPVTNYGTHGTDGFVFTRYAGYATAFPADGYTASADFYLDADAEAGQFSWSHAVNGTDDAHQRDFIFHAGADGAGTWSIGASNNTATSAPYITSFAVTPLEVTESGWYTFQHSFYEDGGVLHADLSVLAADGTVLATWTLGGNAADVVPTVVGGNRYGWLVNNSYADLPVDNVLLDSERPVGGCLDLTALRDVIALAEGVDADMYTAPSFEALQAALADARTVLADALATQAGVDEAAATLSAALDALEPAEATEEVGGDELAQTGAEAWPLVGASVVLTAGGAALLVWRRRLG